MGAMHLVADVTSSESIIGYVIAGVFLVVATTIGGFISRERSRVDRRAKEVTDAHGDVKNAQEDVNSVAEMFREIVHDLRAELLACEDARTADRRRYEQDRVDSYNYSADLEKRIRHLERLTEHEHPGTSDA